MTKPILCVDFDGVIHSYTSGWKGADMVIDPPTPGALRWLWKATEWWDVQIYSSRTGQIGGISGMKEWLRKHARMEWGDDLDFIENSFLASISFPEQKPPAMLTIDDRALTFEGVWADLDPYELLSFKPWNKRPVGATGRFPDGQLGTDDEGEISLGVTRDRDIVRIAFGKPVAWLGMPPQQAIQFARLILKHAGAEADETFDWGALAELRKMGEGPY